MLKFPLEILNHILEEIEFIMEEVDKISEKDFYMSNLLRRAFVRSLEIIGEATKNLPDDLRKRHDDIPWKNMARMRDKLIHHYFGVDYSIVWDVAKNEIPYLHDKILKVIQCEKVRKTT